MAQRQRPGDFTGTQKAQLAKQHAEEVAKREGELSIMNQAELEARESQVVDYSEGTTPLILDDEQTLEQANAELAAQRLGGATDELILDDEAVGTRPAPQRTIMVNDVLESVTIGAGNHYSFEPGVKYRVPAHIADHLEEKGYVYH